MGVLGPSSLVILSTSVVRCACVLHAMSARAVLMLLDSAVVKLHLIWRNFALASVVSFLILLMVLSLSSELSPSLSDVSSLRIVFRLRSFPIRVSLISSSEDVVTRSWGVSTFLFVAVIP